MLSYRLKIPSPTSQVYQGGQYNLNFFFFVKMKVLDMTQYCVSYVQQW